MTVVLDASALLAYLKDEDGSTTVEAELVNGAVCGAANWSEVSLALHRAGRDWSLARSLLMSFSLDIHEVTIADAEYAAALWRPGSGLSLGDRLCLALGHRLAMDVLTADRAWGVTDGIRYIR